MLASGVTYISSEHRIFSAKVSICPNSYTAGIEIIYFYEALSTPSFFLPHYFSWFYQPYFVLRLGVGRSWVGAWRSRRAWLLAVAHPRCRWDTVGSPRWSPHSPRRAEDQRDAFWEELGTVTAGRACSPCLALNSISLQCLGNSGTLF